MINTPKDKTIEQKSAALLDYLKTMPTDKWTTQEEIIVMLPQYFTAQKTNTATTLDRSIHSCVDYINQHGEYIIANNGRRAYKIASEEDAKDYIGRLFKKYAKGFKRAHQIVRVMKLDNTFDLLKNDFNEIFANENIKANTVAVKGEKQ